MSQLETIRNEIKNKYNRYRRMHYQIEKTEFGNAYEEASSTERDLVNGSIRKGNRRAVSEWVSRQCPVSIENMSVRQLYVLAQQKGIHDYKRIPAEQLRKELIDLRDS